MNSYRFGFFFNFKSLTKPVCNWYMECINLNKVDRQGLNWCYLLLYYPTWSFSQTPPPTHHVMCGQCCLCSSFVGMRLEVRNWKKISPLQLRCQLNRSLQVPLKNPKVLCGSFILILIVNQNSIKTLIGYSSMFNININRANYDSTRLIVLTKSDGLIMGSRTREVSWVASSVPIVKPTEPRACTKPCNLSKEDWRLSD